MDVIQKSNLKSSQTSAIIIRADSSREDLGVIAYWHKNPFKRLWFKLKKFFNLGA